MTRRRRAAVFGAAGQIGRQALRALAAAGFDTAGFGRSECDITDATAIDAALTGFGDDDVVLNAAGYNEVVHAEVDFARAMLVNGCAPYFIALAASRRGATLLHFGTDYVFDGSKVSPYVESDVVHPLNAYGITKLCGEILASAAAPRHYLLRVSAVFGVAGKDRRENFVDRVLAAAHEGLPLKLMGDGAVSPTYAAEAADMVAGLLRVGAPFGTYHVANSGACSWFEFAQEVVRLSRSDVRLERLAARDTDQRVRRPLFSGLGSEKLAELGLKPRPWQDGLTRYLQAIGRLDVG